MTWERAVSELLDQVISERSKHQTECVVSLTLNLSQSTRMRMRMRMCMRMSDIQRSEHLSYDHVRVGMHGITSVCVSVCGCV